MNIFKKDQCERLRASLDDIKKHYDVFQYDLDFGDIIKVRSNKDNLEYKLSRSLSLLEIAWDDNDGKTFNSLDGTKVVASARKWSKYIDHKIKVGDQLKITQKGLSVKALQSLSTADLSILGFFKRGYVVIIQINNNEVISVDKTNLFRFFEIINE